MKLDKKVVGAGWSWFVNKNLSSDPMGMKKLAQGWSFDQVCYVVGLAYQDGRLDALGELARRWFGKVMKGGNGNGEARGPLDKEKQERGRVFCGNLRES